MRKTVKEKLMRSRAVIGLNGQITQCDGQAVENHTCSGGAPDLNEVFVTRKTIMKIKDAEKRRHFFDEINCSLMCNHYHLSRGNSKKFKSWFYRKQKERYGLVAVEKWFSDADSILKIKVDRPV
jgi:hypothetical protein